MTEQRTVRTGSLEISYLEHGPASGPPAVLLHGFPYDVHAYEEVAPRLAAAGVRVVVTYLRGCGPTRFVSDDVPRSGEQAALGADLVDLLDALDISSAVLAGFDWGGRAACVVAALHPERAAGLVTAGCAIQTTGGAARPSSPQDEHRTWYQYYFHGERGRAALEEHPEDLCRSLWSPTWAFTAKTFARTATAFSNPDFAAVVTHSYRVRHALVPGDPAHAADAARLEGRPEIGVPTVVLDGGRDGVEPVDAAADPMARFTGWSEYRLLPHVGHDVPQEAPVDFARAVLDVAVAGGA